MLERKRWSPRRAEGGGGCRDHSPRAPCRLPSRGGTRALAPSTVARKLRSAAQRLTWRPKEGGISDHVNVTRPRNEHSRTRAVENHGSEHEAWCGSDRGAHFFSGENRSLNKDESHLRQYSSTAQNSTYDTIWLSLKASIDRKEVSFQDFQREKMDSDVLCFLRQ